jgi:predicted GIY-YIG superfamily endonuclease
MDSINYCYILKNNDPKYKNRTYNGYTNNPKQRIRQHNQEICGGAKYTKKFGQRSNLLTLRTNKSGDKNWQMYVLISGFPTKQNALQCEWKIKHPDNKRKRSKKYNSPAGRVIGLNEVLKLNRWTNNSTINNTFTINIFITKEYEHLLLTYMKPNIIVHVVDSIDFDIVGTNNIYVNYFTNKTYYINLAT